MKLDDALRQLTVDQMIYTARYTFPVSIDGRVRVYEYWTVQHLLIRECVPEEDYYNRSRLDEAHGWRLVGKGAIVADEGICTKVFHDWEERIVRVRWQREGLTPCYPFGFGYRFKCWYRGLLRIRGYYESI